MTSEIKVDTISEQTSANGVTIDGLTIKDGNIQGSPALVGTTPSFTIGDGGAEDTKIVFDGNALDYYIGLDDSADDLVIGTGSTVGSNNLITIDSSGKIGVGESVPLGKMHIKSADSGASVNGVADELVLENSSRSGMTILSGNSSIGTIAFGDDGSNTIGSINYDHSSNALTFFANGSETARFDSSGNFLLGTSATTAGNEGLVYFNGSSLRVTRDSDEPLNLDRRTNDGAMAVFQKDGTPIGNIGVSSSNFVVQSSVSDKDILFKGNDGGSTITALTLDMSEAGVATFNSSINTTGILNTVNNSLLIIGGGNATNAGANLTMYGGASGSAGAFRFRNATTVTANITASGQIEAVSGGVSTPTFAFTTDPNTGMTRPTTDTLQFVTGGAEAMRITSGQTISTGGESSPDVGAGGLGLDQNANDDAIITFKSSDVAHGMTSSVETDTYAIFKKQSATKGGLQIRAFAEDNPNERINIDAQGDGDVTESTSTSTKGAICLISSNKSGSGQGSMNANGNILSIANYSATRFLFEGNGDFHADGGSNTFDEYEDAQLVRAYDLSHGRGVIDSKFDKFVSYNHEKLADLRLVGREEDGTPNHFINVTGFQRLHNGAIWQQYEKHQRLAEAVYEMAKEALGKDKADAILNKHDIKLLN